MWNFHIFICLLLIFKNKISALSFNQPQFCPTSTWNSNAFTFANQSIVGQYPLAIFVNTNNTIYVANREKSEVVVWLEGSIKPTNIISGNFSIPYSLFVTSNGDIYIDDGEVNKRVVKWTSSTNTTVTVMVVNSRCFGLFVDINDNLYCSMVSDHQVMKRWLNDPDITSSVVVAGTGVEGSASNELRSPHGIFVDVNLDLYVTDCNNHRVQLFQLGQSNGITVAGNSSFNPTISLTRPTGIVLDAEKYLFIVDNNNHRIVGSGPNGFRCLVGCYGTGSQSNQLYYPFILSFDRSGNMFVTDQENHRIQKFEYLVDFCDQTTVRPTTSQKQEDQTTGRPTTTEKEQDQTTVSRTTSGKQRAGTTVRPTTNQKQRDGTTNVALTTLAEQESTSMTTRSSPSSRNCHAPEVQLIPKPLSSIALEFRRSHDFHIISLITLNCNQSLTIGTKWTIKNSTTNHSDVILERKIAADFTEIYVPSNTLPYGVYEFILTVTMIVGSSLSTSESVLVQISPTGITANLLPFGTSMITWGAEQDLRLDPGTYSTDVDGYPFQANNWDYNYYYRIYDFDDVSNNEELYLPIDFLNTSGNKTIWQFDDTFNSSVTIFAGSLQSNRTYQFRVEMINRADTAIKTNGYLLVQIQESSSSMIVISCVISNTCISKSGYKFLNPTTQVSLVSHCLIDCLSTPDIKWNIYHAESNTFTNTTIWTPFDRNDLYKDIWCFGGNTNKLTCTKELLMEKLEMKYWRFEVVYSMKTQTSSSSLIFLRNECPSNGSCQIEPGNGTITTLFTISCPDWFDEDEIKDYTLYFWTTDYSKRTIIAFSSVPTFQVRLPSMNADMTLLHLIVQIRDRFDCITERNLTSVHVENDLNHSSLLQLLSLGNQNTIAQIIYILSQQFDHILSNWTNTSVESFGNFLSDKIDDEFWNQQINIYANLREQLINFTNIPIYSKSNSIQLQASAMVQLTKATNQLTRMTCMIASKKCHDLAVVLNTIAKDIPYEDLQQAAKSIAQCTSNVINGVNGMLQQRTRALDLDLSRANTFDDYSIEDDDRNIYYQKQTANEVFDQITKTRSLLTSVLNIHLNINQKFIINTSEIFISFEKLSVESISNQTYANGRVTILFNFSDQFDYNGTILIRSIIDPLAFFGNSQLNTNYSRSISFSLFDENEQEISIDSNLNHSLEIIIPRDRNFILPPMNLQDVILHQEFISIQKIDIQQNDNLTSSVHFEISPLNRNVSYLFIYQFDQAFQLTESLSRLDGWTLFCSPKDLNTDRLYTFYINNHETANHHSLIFGLRELSSIEMINHCSNNSTMNKPRIVNEEIHFTSNYLLRIYSSACYYLDKNNQRKSDGMLVGPKTNHNQTQCFSTHLK